MTVTPLALEPPDPVEQRLDARRAKARRSVRRGSAPWHLSPSRGRSRRPAGSRPAGRGCGRAGSTLMPRPSRWAFQRLDSAVAREEARPGAVDPNSIASATVKEGGRAKLWWTSSTPAARAMRAPGRWARRAVDAHLARCRAAPGRRRRGRRWSCRRRSGRRRHGSCAGAKATPTSRSAATSPKLTLMSRHSSARGVEPVMRSPQLRSQARRPLRAWCRTAP